MLGPWEPACSMTTVLAPSTSVGVTGKSTQLEKVPVFVLVMATV